MAHQPTLLSFISPVQNRGVFSSHWLENRLNLEPDWDESAEDAIDALRAVLEALGEGTQAGCEVWRRAGARKGFHQPVMECFGWRLKYQTYLQGREPDYALFLSEADPRHRAHRRPQCCGVLDSGAVVAGAKKWDLPRQEDRHRARGRPTRANRMVPGPQPEAVRHSD